MHPLAPLTLLAALALFAPRPAHGDEYVDGRGLIYLSRGTYPAAMGWYRPLTIGQPDRAGPWAGLAIAKCKVGRTAEAREHAELAQELESGEPLGLSARGCVALAAGDPDAAEELRRRAADASSFPYHRRELAWFLIHQGRYAEAEEQLQSMADAGWEGLTTRAMLAECALGLGRLEDARNLVDQLRESGSGPRRSFHVETLMALADDAYVGPQVASFPRRLSPFDAEHDLVVIRAEALRRLGLLDRAEDEAARRKREPNHPLGWAILARLALDLDDESVAGELLETALARWPIQPSLLLTLALLEARRGDPGAARTLEQARALGIPAWDVVYEATVATD